MAAPFDPTLVELKDDGSISGHNGTGHCMEVIVREALYYGDQKTSWDICTSHEFPDGYYGKALGEKHEIKWAEDKKSFTCTVLDAGSGNVKKEQRVDVLFQCKEFITKKD